MRDLLIFIHRNFKLISVAVIALLICFTVFKGANRNMASVDASTHNVKYYKCISVEYGMTLTDIANTYYTDDYNCVGDYIDEVKAINNLCGDNITSGATLVVPYYQAPQE